MSDEASENVPEITVDDLPTPQVGDVISFRTSRGSLVRREITSIERSEWNAKRDKIRYNETRIEETTDAETWQVWAHWVKEQKAKGEQEIDLPAIGVICKG